MKAMLNELATKVYQIALDLGFHTSKEPNFGNYIANLHSEVSELWEAWRKGKLNEPCDKAQKMVELGLEPLTCMEEEIADIVIRALDTAKEFKVDIDRAVHIKSEYNKHRPHRNGGKAA
jgi:NTP pyrophosphatase (non-canonical NTP hydrolase)